MEITTTLFNKYSIFRIGETGLFIIIFVLFVLYLQSFISINFVLFHGTISKLYQM